MSKELNALECLEALEQDIKDRIILAEDRQLKLCAVIKQALQRLESIDNANPSEALECLDKLAKQIELDEDTDYLEIRNAHITVEQALLNSEKEHKALEIIKKKNVSVWGFRNRVFGYQKKQNGNITINDTYEYYLNNFGLYHNGFDSELITKEEFNLLKEVLE